MAKIPVRQIQSRFSEEGFSVRDLDTMVLNEDLNHGLHRHDFFFILFIEKGSGIHEIDFIPYELNSYSVFMVRPGQVHRLSIQKGAKGFIIQFTAGFYTPKDIPSLQVLRKVSSKNYCRLSQSRFDQNFSLFGLISTEYQLKQHLYREVIKSYLAILLISLVRESASPAIVSNDSTLYTQERLEELMELLEKHISDKKQVSDYAEMMALSSYQLNAITKQLLQKTVSELINEQLILEAKRFLIATSNQVNQIADTLGYEDPSYFIRFFKKHTGFTPEAFRQNFK